MTNGRGERLPAFNKYGRQLVSHAYVGEAGQVRGISPFASVVEALAQTVQLQDAMLVAAHAAASIVGVVTSDLPSQDVARAITAEGGNPLATMMEQRVGWHETLKKAGAEIKLGANGRVLYLTTGEKFDLLAGKDHYTHFPEHLKRLLMEISRASGVPYEMMSQDRGNATYSSGRLALLDFWSIVEMRRATLLHPMLNLALASVVEEAIDRKFLKYPGGLQSFRDGKNAALRCRWFGPSRPAVDELKSVRAAVERLKAGLTSLAEESAGLGSDWETTMRQRAHERETAVGMGLPDTWGGQMTPATSGGVKK